MCTGGGAREKKYQLGPFYEAKLTGQEIYISHWIRSKGKGKRETHSHRERERERNGNIYHSAVLNSVIDDVISNDYKFRLFLPPFPSSHNVKYVYSGKKKIKTPTQASLQATCRSSTQEENVHGPF